MSQNPVQRRALLVAASLGAASLAGLALRARPSSRHTLPDLREVFPMQLPGWRGSELQVKLVQPPNERGKLFGIYDQVLERVYERSSDGEQVMLSVAYGGEQTGGMELHRPEVCYRANGFSISEQRQTTLALGARRLGVIQLLAAQPGRNEPITYWTMLGDQPESGRWEFRWQQMQAKLRGEILDGMLVRVSSIARDHEAAWAIQADFALALERGLPREWKSRVLGAQAVPDRPAA